MAEETKRPRCAWCGHEILEDSINIPVQSKIDNVFICYECAKKIYLNKELREKRQLFRKLRLRGGSVKKKMTPSALKEYLDGYIIGQDKAKEVLSVAIYNHYKMLRLKKDLEGDEAELDKSNIFIVGPSGCGKTAMLKRVAQVLHVPFAMIDATSITASGYVGEDPEVCLQRLLQAADGDIKKAERGIVYIDEIDKIARKGENLSTTADPGNEAVQQALLKILEGSVVDVPLKGSRKHPQSEVVRINTENILFIVGGAFEGIEKIIAKRMHKGESSLGFGSKLKNDKKMKYNDFILDIRTEDLRKFGMLPEFIGRIPVICPMQELDEEALVSILTKPKNALLKQYQTLMKDEETELIFTDAALKAVAHEAIKRKTGARSLRAIMEEVLHKEMFTLPDKPEVTRIIVDADENDKFSVKEEENIKTEEEEEQIYYGD